MADQPTSEELESYLRRQYQPQLTKAANTMEQLRLENARLRSWLVSAAQSPTFSLSVVVNVADVLGEASSIGSALEYLGGVRGIFGVLVEVVS